MSNTSSYNNDPPIDDSIDTTGLSEQDSRFEAAKARLRATATEQDIVEASSFEKSTANSCNNCQQLEKLLAQSQAKTVEFEALYKRMAADFENYRKRIDRERQEFQNFGIQRTVEALLPALDDLDRAMATLTVSTPPESLLESIKLVFNRINQSLEQIELKPIVEVGEHFDPQYHEPIQQIETADFPDGAVVEVLRKGYMLNGRVIRPALVIVASNNKSTDSEPSSDTVEDSKPEQHKHKHHGHSGRAS